MDDGEVQDFYDTMIDSVVDLNANEERAKIEMKDVLEFEMMLANVSKDLVFHKSYKIIIKLFELIN